MRKGVNKVIIVGNVGQDPETRYMPSGEAVTNLSLATSEAWKDKKNGQPQERTEWHRIVLYNRMAEIADEYLRKGSKVYIEGSLRTRKWQNQQGQDHYTTEIVAKEMQMLDNRRQDGQQPAQQGGYQQQTAQRQAPPQNQPQGVHQRQPQQQAHHQPAGGVDYFDDDIPF